MARALSGSGLLATIGIHHHNKYNHFALADDIMEPFRPFVDLLIYKQMQSDTTYHDLSKERKGDFLQLLLEPCTYKNERSPLQLTMEYVSANLALCFNGTSKKLDYPTLLL
jgi:CRISPR-associated protein Cas1